MRLESKSNLQKSLQVSGPNQELWFASLGCILGTVLLILSVQFYLDTSEYLETNKGPKNYFTINKKIEGGALANLGKKDDSFSKEELNEISKIDGVKKVGGFVRNQFPITLYIWPSGKIGLGAAAKTDLFFESIPDEFLDFIPKEWNWEENSSIVPIMVPKFYLDLWNFGLAPSRVEYPALSTDAATGMPIEIFIGKNRETTLDGRFIAFSKRINSVLVPKSFIKWANKKFGQPDAGDFFFLWKKGVIDGPPRSKSDLIKLQQNESFTDWEISPLKSPADREPITRLLENNNSEKEPSRIILEVEDHPSETLLNYIQKNDYEINREFPDQDTVKKALYGLFLGLAGIGTLLAILSIATFASSYKLLVSRASQPARNLILLGFSDTEVAQVFISRFVKLYAIIIGGAIAISFYCKFKLVEIAQDYGIQVSGGLNNQTLVILFGYTIFYFWINKRVIDKSVSDLI